MIILSEINFDYTLMLGQDILEILKGRKTTFLPHEKDVETCFYLDEIEQKIHIFWGYPVLHSCLVYYLDLYWSNWQIEWNDRGYSGHLELTNRNRNDLLLSEKEAISSLLKIFCR